MSVGEPTTHLETTHHRGEHMLFIGIDAKLATILSVLYTCHKNALITALPLMREKATPASLARLEALGAGHEAGDVKKCLVEDGFLHICKERNILFPFYEIGAT